MIRITSQPTPSNNESLPGILTDAAEVAFATHAACRAYYKPNRAMIQGLVSERPFEVKSFAHFDTASLLPAEVAYLPAVGEGFLSFNTDDVPANNGNLYTESGLAVLDFHAGFTMGVVFRAPPNGGGALIGNMVNQQKNGVNADNQRWAGIALGFGSTVNLGELCAMFTGQSIRVDPPGANDWRDSKWHVAVAIFDYVNQILKIRVDGGLEASAGTATGGGELRDITTVGGGQRLRVAATGLAGGATDYQFKGDIARAAVIASGSVSPSLVTNWETSMIDQFGITRRA